MAIVGTEVLEVQGVAGNGMLSGQTKTATTGQIAALSGYSPSSGTFTITGATPVAVSNTAISTASVVVFALKTVGGTVGAYPSIKTITAGAGFTVSGTTADVSVYNYTILG